MVTDVTKKAKDLPTYEKYKKIWIKEYMTKITEKYYKKVKNKNKQNGRRKNYLESERSPSKTSVLADPKGRDREALGLQQKEEYRNII